jgi:hypothetical protein
MARSPNQTLSKCFCEKQLLRMPQIRLTKAVCEHTWPRFLLTQSKHGVWTTVREKSDDSALFWFIFRASINRLPIFYGDLASIDGISSRWSDTRISDFWMRLWKAADFGSSFRSPGWSEPSAAHAIEDSIQMSGRPSGQKARGGCRDFGIAGAWNIEMFMLSRWPERPGTFGERPDSLHHWW